MSLVFATVRRTKLKVVIASRQKGSSMMKPFSLSAATLGGLLVTALMSGCSSKPDTADIARDLSQMYSCPSLEVTDVVKQDGAKGDGDSYAVSFSYNLNVKGGRQAAGERVAEWASLEMDLEALGKDLNEASDKAMHAKGMYTGGSIKDVMDDPTVRQLVERQQQIADKISKLMPCNGSRYEKAVIMTMFDATKKSVASGNPSIPVIIGAKMRGNAVMAKAESGWHFMVDPDIGFVEMVQSDPVKFTRAAPLAISAPPAAGAERTMTGVMKYGNVDSCFEVTEGTATKCYGFPNKGPMADALAVCAQASRCTVTGQFNDANEQIESIKSAAKAN
jgi:hypothetical protein